MAGGEITHSFGQPSPGSEVAGCAHPPEHEGDALTTRDGRPLRVALAAAQSRAARKAFFLVAPLLLFVLITFVLPIGQLLEKSVHNDSFARVAPTLTAWIHAHAPSAPPDETAYAALVNDLRLMKKTRTAGDAGERINQVVPGTRSLFTSSARAADRLQPPFRESLLSSRPEWSDPTLWQAMRNAAATYTADYYLIALDRQRDAQGHFVPVPAEKRIYLRLFGETFALSALIAVLCLLLAFPVAHLLATLPLSKSNLLMILVLLPFWTSLLVRTSSWIVLLQEQGVLNDVLVSTGILADDHRLRLIYNRTGTIIVMTHILLPFMILPLYSVMRTINPSYLRAARSLGATSWTTFRRIYLPQTLPGVGAGSLLVFILAVGYYITPALVGGADGQLFSNMIQFHLTNSNWSLAAALSVMLLAGVLLLYWLYDRLVGIDKLKFG
jgi:putative spermidine/putrescine transport system permease protein